MPSTPTRSPAKASPKASVAGRKPRKAKAPKATPTRASAGARSKRPRKEKNDDKPKRPLNGFMLYSQQHRLEVAKANPSLNLGGVAKELGAMWRALPPEQKAHYKS